MKKYYMLVVAAVLFSCSKEEIVTHPEQSSNVDLEMSAQGEPILKFKDTKGFLEEYSKLSKFGSEKDFQDWINTQGHNALLSKSDSIFGEPENMEILYSDALMTILNSSAEFKIGKKTIRLNKDKFYVVAEDGAKVENKASSKETYKYIGSLHNLGDSKEYNLLESKNKSMENANRWKTYIHNVGSKRLITELYNETIYFTDGNFSSKMFLRFRKDYESCSFWRCTWKNDSGTQRKINISLSINSIHWNRYGSSVLSTNFYAVGHYNILVAEYAHQTPYLIDTNFAVNGYISTTIVPTGYIWTLNNVSWYPNEN